MPNFFCLLVFFLQKFCEEKSDDFPDPVRPSASGLGRVELIASVKKWPSSLKSTHMANCSV